MANNLFQAERLNQMTRLVRERGYADINELAVLFGVSKVTVRRDVDVLVEKGVVERAHGGVLAREDSPTQDLPYQTRLSQNIENKQKIGRKAATFIEPGDVIYLDAGTTTFEVARNINTPDVTVVTHDLYIAFEIATSRRANLIVTGGALEQQVYTLTGEETTGFIQRLHVNRAFLGCDALDTNFGISNRLLQEVPTKLAIREAANTLILVTDAGKLHQKALYSIFPLDQIDIAIMDYCDGAFKTAFQSLDIPVVEAG